MSQKMSIFKYHLQSTLTKSYGLIIDDTDLPKTGFKTEMIGRIYSHVLHSWWGRQESWEEARVDRQATESTLQQETWRGFRSQYPYKGIQAKQDWPFHWNGQRSHMERHTLWLSAGWQLVYLCRLVELHLFKAFEMPSDRHDENGQDPIQDQVWQLERIRHHRKTEKREVSQVQPQAELSLCLYRCRIFQSENPYILL